VLVCHAGERLFALAKVCSHADRPLAGGLIRNCAITCRFMARASVL
jgi:nitrite reductase/ring-hydroxylating ferredoxin subunit